MEFYIATRFLQRDKVRRIHEELRAKGHTIGYDWTNESLTRPYSSNEKLAEEIAIRSVKASESCDVFVLISDTEGTDMYAELGSAITSNKPRVYVIGDFLDRSKLFFHPRVRRMKGLDDVLRDIEETK